MICIEHDLPTKYEPSLVVSNITHTPIKNVFRAKPEPPKAGNTEAGNTKENLENGIFAKRNE